MAWLDVAAYAADMGEDEIAVRAGRDVVALRKAIAELKHLQCKRRQMGESLDAAKALLASPTAEAWEAATPMEWFDKAALFQVVREIEALERRIASLRRSFEDLM